MRAVLQVAGGGSICNRVGLGNGHFTSIWEPANPNARTDVVGRLAAARDAQGSGPKGSRTANHNLVPDRPSNRTSARRGSLERNGKGFRGERLTWSAPAPENWLAGVAFSAPISVKRQQASPNSRGANATPAPSPARAAIPNRGGPAMPPFLLSTTPENLELGPQKKRPGGDSSPRSPFSAAETTRARLSGLPPTPPGFCSTSGGRLSPNCNARDPWRPMPSLRQKASSAVLFMSRGGPPSCRIAGGLHVPLPRNWSMGAAMLSPMLRPCLAPRGRPLWMPGAASSPPRFSGPSATDPGLALVQPAPGNCPFRRAHEFHYSPPSNRWNRCPSVAETWGNASRGRPTARPDVLVSANALFGPPNAHLLHFPSDPGRARPCLDKAAGPIIDFPGRPPPP